MGDFFKSQGERGKDNASDYDYLGTLRIVSPKGNLLGHSTVEESLQTSQTVLGTGT